MSGTLPNPLLKEREYNAARLKRSARMVPPF